LSHANKNDPIIDNPYSTGFEIYEGHHRAACFCVLDMDINCRLYEAIEK
jgi:hypothetical protein